MIDDSFACGVDQESNLESQQKQGTSLIKDVPSVSAIEGGEHVGSSTNVREQVSFGGPGAEFFSRG